MVIGCKTVITMGLPIPSFISRFGKLSVDLLVMFILFALVLGTDVAYGEQAPTQMNILYMYMFLFLSARVLVPGVERKQAPLGMAMQNFLILFVVTAIVMSFLPAGVTGLLAASSFDIKVGMMVTYGVLYAFIKAYIEEDIFRNRLSAKLGETGQAVAFGAFHFFALVGLVGFSYVIILPVAILMGLGYLWGKVQDRFGTLGSTGSHFAYNAAVLGLLPKIMGTVV